ncbi:MAG: FMN-binding protein [Gammaproteobacteria bacterium]|nr:FMN-binding protein [Gammaproteobacteria bacterium]
MLQPKITNMVFNSALFILFALINFSVLAQNEWQNLEDSWLQDAMPLAKSFSEKQGDPPVYLAFQSADESELIGYVFTTPDIPPEEDGFSGPIDALIGMNLDGEITGVKVLFYRESYKYVRGDFIVDSGFPEQFTGKAIADEFRLRADIDGISRATISSWALARGIRNATRRVAMAYLPGSSFVVEANVEIDVLQTLRGQSWDGYLASGFVKEFSVPIAGEPDLNFALAYIGHYRLGALLVGAIDYSNSDRTASEMIEDGHMILLGLTGNTSRLQQLRLGAMQNGILYPNRGDRVVFAGTADEGKIAGRAQFAIALFMHPGVDITQPFTIVYDTSEVRGEFNDYVGVDYQLPEDVLTLVMGIPAIEESPVTQSVFSIVILLLALILFVLNLPRLRANKSG